MAEQLIQNQVKFSFFKKTLFYFKVNKAIKDCKDIELHLINNAYLTKFDSRLNLIISDGSSNDVDDNYFLVKTYSKDGNINPIIKYTITDGEIKEHFDEIKRDIIVIDLYEKSIYLHSFYKNSRYITGYLIKEEIQSEINKTLIFSNEKVKINIKNTNKFETINVVDDFINHYII